jgi:dienelactone hydrolase
MVVEGETNELAEVGFIAVAPDLFWRQEPGVDLDDRSEPDWQHGPRLYQAYDRDAGVEDVKATVIRAAGLPDCTGVLSWGASHRRKKRSRLTFPGQERAAAAVTGPVSVIAIGGCHVGKLYTRSIRKKLSA